MLEIVLISVLRHMIGSSYVSRFNYLNLNSLLGQLDVRACLFICKCFKGNQSLREGGALRMILITSLTSQGKLVSSLH